MAHDTDTNRAPSSTGAYVPVSDSSSDTKKAPRRFAAKQVFATVLIVLAVVLGFENTGKVNIRLIGPVENAPLWILVFAPLALGLIAGFLLGHKSTRGRKRK